MKELFKAIKEDNILTVMSLVDNGADINAKDEDGHTALIVAAKNGHTEIVNLLLNRGADINAKDKDGETALIKAAFNGHTEIVTTLIELGADIPEDITYIIRTMKKASWWTDSHTAVINNRLDDIQNVEDQSSPITPLDLAIMIGNLNAIEYITERGSISTSSPTLFNSSNGTNFDINYCLNKAIKHKRNEIAMFLLEKGADPNAKKGADPKAQNENGKTALMNASLKGNTEIVNLLLDHGADINAKTISGQAALNAAVQRGHTEIVRLLLDRGADINAKDSYGNTALSNAAFNGHTEIVKLLLDHGADIHAKDSHGDTALMHATSLGKIETVILLIELGADIPEDTSRIIRTMKKASWWTDSHTAVINNRLDDIQNVEDQSSPITPLDLAIMIGNLNAVEYIIERGSRSTSSATLFSSSNGTNFDINYCLNKAIKHKRNEIAMFLLEKGADPKAENQLGQNSLHIACSYGNKDIIEILVENMNKGNTNPRL
jgi:ankyrin repeat protein